jgi:hypothetical protein
MEHSLHLAVGHVLSHVTPVHTGKTHVGKDDDNESLAGVVSDDSTAIISHALRKLLGLIKQVRLIEHIYYIELIHLLDTKIASSSCIL